MTILKKPFLFLTLGLILIGPACAGLFLATHAQAASSGGYPPPHPTTTTTPLNVNPFVLNSPPVLETPGQKTIYVLGGFKPGSDVACTFNGISCGTLVANEDGVVVLDIVWDDTGLTLNGVHLRSNCGRTVVGLSGVNPENQPISESATFVAPPHSAKAAGSGKGSSAPSVTSSAPTTVVTTPPPVHVHTTAPTTSTPLIVGTIVGTVGLVAGGLGVVRVIRRPPRVKSGTSSKKP